ncbi:hypothetical protein QFW85_04350 [Vibrio chagasii]|uniref:hypothetical protein n=1 Tax=Vibrio chagasii TaxID=170679 RepID=UPI003DA80B3B
MNISNNYCSTQTTYTTKQNKVETEESISSDAGPTTTPDPEYQPSVKWDDDSKLPEKLGIDGVHNANWSHHQGERQWCQEQQSTRKEETAKTVKPGPALHSTIVLPPTIGHILVFSKDGKLPSKNSEENTLWIPIQELGDREKKVNDFLSGRELVLVSEQPFTEGYFRILRDKTLFKDVLNPDPFEKLFN